MKIWEYLLDFSVRILAPNFLKIGLIVVVMWILISGLRKGLRKANRNNDSEENNEDNNRD
jgi:hypothetical protein